MSLSNFLKFDRTAGLTIIFSLPFAAPIQLNCSFYNSANDIFITDLYACFGTTKDIEYSGITIDSVEGTHDEGKSFNDTNGLRVSSQKWPYIPQGIGGIFKNLESLELSYCDLEVLLKEDLKQFPNLKVLSLPNNRLTSLDSGLFQFNSMLKSFDAHRNMICSVASDIFDRTNDLEEIDLTNNYCFTVAVGKKQIQNLKRSIAERSRCESEFSLESLENSSEIFSTSTPEPVAITEKSCEILTSDEEGSDSHETVLSTIKATEDRIKSMKAAVDKLMKVVDRLDLSE